MCKKILLFILLISMFFMPNVYAEEDKFTIVSGDLDTINSEICFGDDCFYVLGNDGNVLRLLSKYNITVEDNPVQSVEAEGLSFTEEPYWGDVVHQDAKYVYDSNSNLYNYVEAYKDSLIEKGVVVEKARLVNQEELYLGGVDVITYTWPTAQVNFDSSFWSGVAYDDSNVWTSELEQARYTNSYFKIRPVIEIPVGWLSGEKKVYIGGTNCVKISDGVTSNNTESVNLIFNNLGQSAKYETIIYNDTEEIMYVNDINVEGLSESYISVLFDEGSKNKQIEAGGASVVSFYVKTLSEEGAGKNLDDEVKINFLVSNSIVNPDTFSNKFEFFILVIVLSVVVICILKVFKNKKISFLVMSFWLLTLGTYVVSADEYLKITLLGNIKYKSLNVIETTGTVLNGMAADYTNSKDVWGYYDKVKNIYVKSLVDKPKKYFKKFDLSVDDGNRVIAYLVENGDKTIPYDLYIMSNGVIIANEDSSFLFSFPNVEKIEGLSNIDFSETINMQGMFVGNTKLEIVDIKSIDMSSAKDVSYMFYDNKKLNVTVKDFDVSNVENMEYMTQNYFYDVIKANASSDENLDYLSSFDSGNFLYNKSKNETNPIYYYRGNVEDNNVKFAGYCWQIVRTTDTGGIKLIYNGVPMSNGSCESDDSNRSIGLSKFNGDVATPLYVGYMYGDIYSYSYKTIVLTENVISLVNVSTTANYYFGDSITYENGVYTLQNAELHTWYTDYSSLNGYYTCKSNSATSCSNVYYVSNNLSRYSMPLLAMSGGIVNPSELTLIVGKSYVSNDDGTYTLKDIQIVKKKDWYSSESTKYKNFYVCDNSSNEVCNSVYLISETYNTMFYKEKSQTFVYGNSVIYNDGMYTLIDTIKSDSWSTDLLKLADGYHYTCFNDTGVCSEVGYVEQFAPPLDRIYYFKLSGGKKLEDMNAEMFDNKNSSIIKNYIDNWYANNLVGYTNYLEDTEWCNDKTVVKGTLVSEDFDAKNDSIGFAFASKLKDPEKYSSLLKCSEKKWNFKVDNGNGVLIYPVGLLTADEVFLAGLVVRNYFDPNSSGGQSYLTSDNSTKVFWTMTPSHFGARSSVYLYSDSYGLMNTHQVQNSGYVRPSISLKSGTQFITGDGSFTNPYIVE